MHATDVMLCYLMLLNRAPTAPELAQGQSQGLLDLLADVVREGEFAQRFFSAYWGLDEGNRHQRATHAFYAYVEALGDTRLKALETALRALPRIPDQGHDYVAYHHLRMRELMGFLARWHDTHPVSSLLDVGFSPFFGVYPQVLPNAERWVADIHPLENDTLQAAGAHGAYRVDLNRQALAAARGGPVDRRFDVVVFTEVLEHLLLDPVEALQDLLDLLSPEGVIYFSTPNYFSYGCINRLLAGRNPQPRYTRADGNRGFHYHLREYSFKELAEAVRTAGGEVVMHAFSDCWDKDQLPPNVQEQLPIALRSNLVLIVRHAGAPNPNPPRPVPDQTAHPLDSTAAFIAALAADANRVRTVTEEEANTPLNQLAFDEAWYLARYPDVAEAVREQAFRSGWEHYALYGIEERRSSRNFKVRTTEPYR